MNSKSETNFAITCSKYLMKLSSDFIVKIGTLEKSNINFGTILILGLIWPRKYFIKFIFDIKIQIDILEILNETNFNKFSALLILGKIWA